MIEKEKREEVIVIAKRSNVVRNGAFLLTKIYEANATDRIFPTIWSVGSDTLTDLRNCLKTTDYGMPDALRGKFLWHAERAAPTD